MSRSLKTGLAALVTAAALAVFGEASEAQAQQVTYTGNDRGTPFSVIVDYSGGTPVVAGGRYGHDQIVTTLLRVSQFDDNEADFDIVRDGVPGAVGAGNFTDAAGNDITPQMGQPVFIRFRK